MKNKNTVTLLGITFAIIGLLVTGSSESFGQVSTIPQTNPNGSQTNLGVGGSQPGSPSGSQSGLQSSTQSTGSQNNSQANVNSSTTSQAGILTNTNGSQTVTIAAGTGAAGANSACANAKNCFNPGVVNVKPGSSVTWMNNDNVIHTVTSGKSTDTDVGKLFDKNIPVGKSISLQFNNTGTVDYFCKVHPWMSGQVTVGSANNSSNIQGGTLGSQGLTNSSTNNGLVNQPSGNSGQNQPNTSPSGSLGNTAPGPQTNPQPNTSVPGP